MVKLFSIDWKHRWVCSTKHSIPATVYRNITLYCAALPGIGQGWLSIGSTTASKIMASINRNLTVVGLAVPGLEEIGQVQGELLRLVPLFRS